MLRALCSCSSANKKMQPSWRQRFITWQVNRANRLILVVRLLKKRNQPQAEVIRTAEAFSQLVQLAVAPWLPQLRSSYDWCLVDGAILENVRQEIENTNLH